MDVTEAVSIRWVGYILSNGGARTTRPADYAGSRLELPEERDGLAL